MEDEAAMTEFGISGSETSLVSSTSQNMNTEKYNRCK
jgi:hypothetical protein